MKKRPITINGRQFQSMTEASLYWKIKTLTLNRWINKYGTHFKTGDLEIYVADNRKTN